VSTYVLSPVHHVDTTIDRPYEVSYGPPMADPDFVAHGLTYDPDTDPNNPNRKKKRSPEPAPSTDLGYGQLAQVERASYGTLPTRVSFALSGVKDQQKILARSAKLIARSFDVNHNYIFGANQLKDYLDPIYDGPIRMSTVRRLTGDFQIPALESMLKYASLPTVTEGHAKVDTRTPGADPRRVRAFAEAFAGYVDANNIDATEGISMAVYLAANSKGVTVDTFRSNLGLLYKWVADTGRDQEFSWQELLLLARNSAQAKIRFKSNLDVVKFLDPNLGAAYEA
jgi:hypothetical protein